MTLEFFMAIHKLCRAIDVHSLIGYMGGYVGLLLGVSILQIPELLQRIFVDANSMYDCILRMHGMQLVQQMNVP